MLRVLVTIVLPIALPFLAYGVYLAMVRRRQSRAGAGAQTMPDEVPWPWLLGAGLVLLAIVLGGLRVLDGYRPGTDLAPPRYQGGEIVPGGPVER
jgi:hypothetical protein